MKLVGATAKPGNPRHGLEALGAVAHVAGAAQVLPAELGRCSGRVALRGPALPPLV